MQRSENYSAAMINDEPFNEFNYRMSHDRYVGVVVYLLNVLV